MVEATRSEVGPLAVVSRLHLVVQSIAAAFADMGQPSVAVYWDGGPVGDIPALDASQAVVLVDDLDTTQHVRQARELVATCTAPVLVLTAHSPGPVWGALFTRRHVAVLSARTSLEEVLATMRRLRAGEEVVPAEVRHELVREWVDWVARAADFQTRLTRLSRRERTVLDLLASGRRVSEVAEQLGVAEGTVRSQVKSLRRKLGVDTQIAAVAAVNLYSGEVAAMEVLPPRPREPLEGREPGAEVEPAEGVPQAGPPLDTEQEQQPSA